MAAGQPLRGLVGQGMDGRKKVFQAYAASYPPGSHTWTSPRTAYYRFTQWGAGGNAGVGNPSASGSLTQTVVRIPRGYTVAIVNSDSVGVDSTLTFPGGRLVTSGSGASNTPGVAVGGDLNLNGSVAGASGLGNNGGASDPLAGGAPGQGPYKGAAGGTHGPAAGFVGGSAGGYGFTVIASQAGSLL